MTDRRKDFLSFSVAALLAVLLRSFGLLERSFWFDEAMSWRTVILPWRQMLASISENTHAPLFFCLLKVWVSLFGEALESLRLFNVAITLGIMLTIDRWLAADAAASRATRFLACAFVAASPLQIRLAGEVRMYPLLVLLSIASTWALWIMLHDDPGWRSWTAYALAVLAMLYTHYFGLFIFLAQVSCYCAMELFRRCAASEDREGERRAADFTLVAQPSRVRPLVLACLAITLGCLPWAQVFWRQRQRVSGGWWTNDFSADDVLRVIAQWFFSDEIVQREPWLAWVALGLVVCTFAAALFWGGRLGRLAGSISLIATILVIGSSYCGTNLMVARYFAAFQALWLLAVASLIGQLPECRMRYVLGTATIMLFAVVHGVDQWLGDVLSRPGVRAAVAFMEAKRLPGEPMLSDSSFIYFPASFHASQRNQLRMIVGPAELAYFTGGPVIRSTDRMTLGELGRLTTNRIWLLSGQIPQSYPLPAGWVIERQWFFFGTAPFQDTLRVISYVPQPRGQVPQSDGVVVP